MKNINVIPQNSNGGGGYSLNIVKQANVGMLSNPNILINGDFRNPVNQRGQNSYQFRMNTYFIDMWRTENTLETDIIDIDDDGLSFTITGTYNLITQAFESDLIGQTVTVSILYQDGLIHSKTFVATPDIDIWHEMIPGVINTQVSYWTKNDGVCALRLLIYKSCKIAAVKLEKGTVSTLHLDPSTNYAAELHKCQYYLHELASTSDYYCVGLGNARSTSLVLITVPLPQMRIRPTLSYSGKFVLISGSGPIDVTGILLDRLSNATVQLAATSAGLVIGQTYELWHYPNDDGTINSSLLFSAEL